MILQSSHSEFEAMHSAQSATMGASTAHPRGDRAVTAAGWKGGRDGVEGGWGGK